MYGVKPLSEMTGTGDDEMLMPVSLAASRTGHATSSMAVVTGGFPEGNALRHPARLTGWVVGGEECGS